MNVSPSFSISHNRLNPNYSLSVHAMLIHTMEPAFCCSPSVYVMLVDIMGTTFAVHCPCMRDACTTAYCQCGAHSGLPKLQSFEVTKLTHVLMQL